MNAPVFLQNQTVSASVSEVSGFSGATTITTSSFLVNFTDQGTAVSPGSEGDFHGLIVTGLTTPGFGLPLGTLNATVTNEATGPADPNGTIQWSFSINNELIDYLEAGEFRTERFEIKLLDADGNFVTQIIEITITGSNDGPVFTSSDASASFTESEDPSHTASGAFTFDDLDVLQDGDHAVTFTVHSVAGTGPSGSQPSPAALESFFNASLDQIGTDNNTGNAAWTFTAPDSAFDYLGMGETLVITYRVAVSDGIAPAITRDVVVTITGANDTVAISAETASISDTSGNDTIGPIDGAFDISDLDVTDNHTFSVAGEAVDISVDGFDRSVSHALGTLYFNSDIGAYRFLPNEAAIEALKAGTSVVFNVTVDDNNGSTATNTFTINIDATNDAADITGDVAGAVIEAGGVLNASAGTPTATGNLDYTDRDDTADVWNTTVVTNGQYGTLTIDAAGAWSYALDNDNAFVQGLKTSGDMLQDTITVASSDGTQQQITITITGQNDAAVILGTSVSTGTVTEAGGVNNATNPTSTASGDVNHTDVDSSDAEDAWTPATISGFYGTLVINAAGEWTYTLDNDRPAVKARDTGAPVFEHITVFTTDNTAHNIVIMVNGSNDAPVVGAITAPDALNEGNGLQALNASGSFIVTDEDGGDALTPSVTAATLAYSGGAGNIPGGLETVLAALGNVSFSPLTNSSNSGAPAAFNWTYAAAGAALDFLRDGETLTITYTVQVSDGDASHTQPLVITITGTNDVPTIAGGTIGSGVVEAGTAAGTSTVTGNLSGIEGANWIDLDRTEDDTLAVTKGSFGAASQAVLLFDNSAPGSQPGEAAINGTYGTLYLKADGTYRYVLDDTRPATQALDLNDPVTETFNYTIANNGGDIGNEATSTLTINITGANDGPTGISVVTGIANYVDPALTAELRFNTGTDTATIDFQGTRGDSFVVSDVDEDAVLTIFDADGSTTFNAADVTAIRQAATFVWSNGSGVLGSSSGTTTGSGGNPFPNTGTLPTAALSADDRADILNAFDISGVNFDSGTGELTVNWTFDNIATGGTANITIDNNNSGGLPTGITGIGVNFLAAGETLTVTFPVTITDQHGATHTVNVPIVFTGANDAPTTTANRSLFLNEGGGNARFTDPLTGLLVDNNPANPANTANSGLDNGFLQISGVDTHQIIVASSATTDNNTQQINFSDTDRTDVTHTVTVSSVSVSTTGGTGAPDSATALSWLTATLTARTAGNNGQINWTFQAADSNFDFLAAGQTLTLVYQLNVNDGLLSSSNANGRITVTITGTNDGPTITAAVTEDTTAAEAGGALNGDLGVGEVTGDASNGGANWVDKDTSEDAGLEIKQGGVTSGGQVVLTFDGSAPGANAGEAAISGTYGTLFIQANGQYRYVLDNMNPATQALDIGSSVSEVFHYTIGNTGAGSATSTITINISGANDNPVLAAITPPAAFVEDGNASSQDLSVSGTLSVTDVDASDTLTASSGTATAELRDASNEVVTGVTIPPELLTGLTFTGTPSSASGAPQSITWTYDPAAVNLDFLKAGDSLTITFPVTVTDSTGTSSTQNLVITITGTNDVPTITGDSTAAGTAAEAGGTNNGAPVTAEITGDASNGGANWTDLDRGEDSVLAITQGGTPTGGQTALTFTGGNGNEAVIAGTYGTLYIQANGQYRYVLNNLDVDTQALDGGQNVSDVFHYTIGNNSGGPANEASSFITINISGTNDNPVLDAITAPLAIEEDVNAAAQDLFVTGSLTVTDVDASDTLTANQGTATAELRDVSNTVITGVTIPPELLTGLTFTGTPSSTSGAPRSITWTYDPAAVNLDFLKAGDSLTITFPVTVTDGTGTSNTQNLVITITGTNDGPVAAADTNGTDTVIEAGDQPAVTGDASASGNVLTNDTDKDAGDTKVVVTAGAASPTSAVNSGTTSADGTVIVGTYGTLTLGADGSWNYELNNGDTDTNGLAAGQAATDVFTYTMQDGSGATSTSTLTINLVGSNDAPVITAGVVSGSMSEAPGTPSAGNPVSLSGSFSFTDADLNDRPGSGDPSSATLTKSFVSASGLTGAQLTAAQNLLSALTPTLVSGATNNGTVNWTFAPGTSGLDFLRDGQTSTIVFAITLADGKGGTARQEISITLTGSNDPISLGTTVQLTGAATEPATAGGTAVATGTILFTDADLAGNPVLISKTGGSVGGSLTSATTVLNANTGAKQLVWTYSVAHANIDYLGLGQTTTETFTITIADQGSTGSITQTVTVTVTGTNDVPTVAAALSASGTEDAVSPVVVNLLQGAADADASAVLSVSNVQYAVDSGAASSTPPAGVSLTGSSLSVDPTDPSFDSIGLGENRIITVTYNVTDEHGASVPQTATITIQGTNDVPTVAAALSASGTEDAVSPVVVNLLQGAADADASAVLSVSNVQYAVDSGAASSTPPAGVSLTGSSLSVDPTDPSFDSIGLGENRIITVTYNVTDEHGASVPQTATITIQGTNDVPTVAAALSASGTEDAVSPVVVNLLQGAADADASAVLSVSNVQYAVDSGAASSTPPAGVSLTGSSLSVDPTDPSFDSIGLGENRIITVTYNVTDEHGASVPQTATITIQGTNDVPTVAAALSASGTEDAVSPVVVNLLQGAADADASAVLSVSNVQYAVDSGAASSTPPAGVSLTGSSLSVDPTDPSFDSIGLGENRIITVTYNVTDEHGASVPQTATITIQGTNDVPTVAAALSASGTEDAVSPVVVNLLQGAADADASAVLSVSNVQYAVDSGAASSTPPAGVSLTGSSLSVDPTDPSFDSIGLGENRIITVTYNVTDEHGASVPQTATITIQGTNDVPTVAAALSASGTEDAVSPVVVNLLQGAADADASAVLSVSNVQYAVDSGAASSTPPAGVSLTGSSLSVDPTDPSFDSIGLGENRIITVTYNVTDEHGASVPQTATITIQGTNDVPTVAAALSASGTEDAVSPVVVNLLQGAADADASAVLSVSNVQYAVDSGAASSTPPAGVSLTGSSLSVDPTDPSFDSIGLGENRIITVTYNVTDEHGASVPQTATITIQGTNDAPVLTTAVGGNVGAITESATNLSQPSLLVTSTVSGLLSATDVDQGAVLTWHANAAGTVSTVSGTYGSFTILANGSWTYELNQTLSDGLSSGQTVQETFTAYVKDNNGAVVAQTVTVTVSGSDESYIGDGTDNTIFGSSNDDVMSGLGGDDNLTGNSGADEIDGGDGSDILTGGSGADTLIGGLDDDILNGGNDNDTLQGGAGSDSISGGSGTGDTLVLSGSWLDYTVVRTSTAGSGNYTITALNGDVDTVTGVELVQFGTGPSVAIADILNDAPVVANAIVDQAATEETPFSFTLPSNTFSDADSVLGDTLSYSFAVGAPNWLSINANTGLITGTSPLNFFGTVTVTVIATDAKGLTASDTFNINVANVNDAPVVAAPLADQTGTEDTAFSYTVPAGTFTDVDLGDTLSYSLGSGSPAWLSINAATGEITGTPPANFNGVVTVTVVATDAGGLSASDAFDLTIGAVNDAPVVAAPLADQTGTEDTAFSYTVPAGTFTDVDLGDTLSYSLGSGSPAWLSINAATGEITGTPPANFNGVVTVTVVATDAGGLSASDAFDLTIGAVNDAPVVAAPLADQTGTEDTAFSYTVPAGTFTDVDLGDTLSYSLGSGSPAWLSINAATGEITGTPPANFNGVVTVTVVATDAGGLSASDAFDLTIGAVNDAPVVAAPLADQTGTEDTAFSYTVPAGTFTDVDLGDTLSYSLGSGSPAWLSINAATGEITGTPPANFNGVVTVTVVATDAGGLSASDAFDLTIGAVNDAPVVAAPLADQTGTEDTAFSYTVPAGTFTDVDLGDTLSYSLGSGSPAWLSINAATGEITGTPPANFNGVVTVTVVATDAGGLSASDAFDLTIGAVNDAPVVAAPLADQTGTEDTAFSYTVPAGTFTDVDLGDTLSYSLGSGSPAWLSINAATGEITGTPPANFNGVVTVTVVATDAGGLSASDAFDLTIGAVNDAPVVAAPLADQTGTEDTAFSYTVPAGTFTDVDLGDTLSYSLGSGSPAWLSINAATGEITGTPPANFNGVVTVTVVATDAGGLSASDAFDLTIGAVNDAPVVAAPLADQTGTEDTAFSYTVPAGTFTDVDLGDTLSYSLGSGSPAWLSINAATGEITGTPPANFNGVVTVTVVATDAGGLSASDAFDLTIGAVNDAPVVAAPLADQTGTEDTAFSYTVPAGTFTDVDLGDTLSYSLGSGSPAWLSINAATGEITGTPPANFNGVVTVTVVATDAGGLSASDAFDLTIGAVNDAPVVAAPLADQTGTEDTAFSYTVPAGTFTDVDLGDTLSYSLGSGSPAWLSINAATGEITGTPPANFNGVVTVTVVATDAGGLSASDAFDLTIGAVNDAPVVAAPLADQTGTEDTAFSYTVPAGTFTDVDLGDTLSYSLGSGSPAWLSINAATGEITGTPPANFNGVVTVTVVATDAGGLSASDAFDLTIGAVNDAPVVAAPLADQTGTEDTAFSYTVPAGTFTDVDLGDTLSYSLGSGSPAWLSINAATGEITGTPPANFNGVVTVTVVATDAGGLSASDAFDLTIGAVNDAPVVAAPLADQTGTEDTAFSYTVPAGTFTDVDLGDTLSYSLGSGSPAWLSINAATGEITGTPPANFNGVVTVTVVATDAGGLSASDAFDLTIGAVNDAPVVAAPLADQTGTEDTAFSYTVPAGTFTDVDLGDTLSYSLGSGSPAWLSINAATGEITGTPPANFNGVVTVTVVATDAGGLSASDAFDLTIGAVNDAPVVAAPLADQTGTEDTAFSYTVPAGTFTDVDLGDTLSYSLGSGSPAWLSINAATGEITGTPPANFNGVVTVTVVATDAGGLSASDAFDLTIGAVNDAPVVAAPLADQTGTEDTAFSYTVPAGTFTDVDLGDTLSYSLGSGSPAWLSINAATGEITGTPPANFNGVVTVTVVATDAGGLSASDAFDLTIGAVNDAPVVAAPLADQTGTEDTAFSYTVPAGTFTDVDLGDTLSYSLGSGSPAWLSINAATGEITGTPPANFNGVVTVTVVATDAGGLSASDAFDLTIGAVNDAPVVAAPLADQTGTEDTAFSYTVPAGTFTDVDLGDTLSYSLGSGSPAWLSINAATGEITGTPPANFNGVVTVTVVATDAGGLSASDAFDLTIGAVNDAPVVAAPLADQTGTEDTAFSYTVPAGTFTDVDLGDTLSYSLGSGSPAWLSINAATGEITGTPPANFNGVVTVTVVATDAGGLSASDAFDLTIGAVNDAPVVAAPLADQTGTEDTAFSYTVPAGTFTDVDLGDTLSYSLGSGSPAWLSINAATGEITGTPPANFNGVVTVTVVATDAGGLSASDAFDLTIGAVNDAPVVAAPLADQTGTEDTAFSYTVPAGTFTDVDLGDTLSYSLGSGSPAWLSINAATGEITGTPPANFNGVVTVTVVATDAGGLSASDAFDLTIGAVNDAPVVAAPLADQTGTEDTAFSYTVPAGTFTDVDLGDTLSYSLGSGSPAWLSINAATGEITGTPPANFNGVVTVTVVATDAGGLSASDAFDLTIGAVNDAPVAVDDVGPAQSENIEAPGYVDFNVTANDSDVDNAQNSLTVGSLNVSVSTLNATVAGLSQVVLTGLFSTPGEGVIRFTPGTTLDALNQGETAVFTVTYTLTDPVGGTSIANLTFTVNGADEIQIGDGGNNVITGSAFDDQLFGLGGNDTITGNSGKDTIDGGDNDDILNGGNGDDTLIGGDGNDTLNGEGGLDSFIGGAGNDTFVIDAAGETVTEAVGGGTDTVLASVTYALTAGQEIENLRTTNEAGVDAINLTGNSFANNIRGNNGTNTISGGAGADTMVGLAGDDSYIVDNAGDIVNEVAGQGTDSVFTSVSYALTVGQEIENLRTTNQAGVDAINLTGNSFANNIRGNNGTNTISGGAGADTMVGLAGDDSYIVDNAGDIVNEVAGQGTDSVFTSVSYALTVGQEIENLRTTNQAGVDAINLTGNSFANNIRGNNGTNTISGGAGADTMVGLAGDDSYIVDNAGDIVNEVAGQGTDSVFTSVSYALTVGQEIENLRTTNQAGVDAINLTGNSFANNIRGNNGTNTISGGAGADTMVGLAGNDSYIVDNAGDIVNEVAGQGTDSVFTSVSYALTAGQEIENLRTTNPAGVTALNLTGNEFAQTVAGNAGNNILNGKQGNDTLTGGDGLDSFVFDTALGAGNVDTITSFITADDTIVLENAIFATLGVGALAAGAFNTGAAATQADDRIIFDSVSKALLYDADGLGGVAAIQFASITTTTGVLSAADFSII